MLKTEFEKLVGHSVSDGCYKAIETVYMESDWDFDKKGIAEFYKKKDMAGIEQEYSIIMKDHMIKDLREKLEKERRRAYDLEHALITTKNTLNQLIKGLNL